MHIARQSPLARCHTGLPLLRGFSLLELLLVLLIIALMTGALLTSVSLGEGDPARTNAQRLQAIIGLARDDAQAQERNLALGFWLHGWRFYALADDGHWLPLATKGPLRPHTLGSDLDLQLQVDGQLVALPPLDRTHPQVFLLSSGETQPFILTIAQDGKPRERLRGDTIGRIKLEPVDAR